MNDIIKDILAEKRKKFGNKADISDLAEKFAEYWITGERIKVKFVYGEVKSGKVGITTGWKPVFILMLTSRSRGSSYTLAKEDKIIAIGKPGKTLWKYEEIGGDEK